MFYANFVCCVIRINLIADSKDLRLSSYQFKVGFSQSFLCPKFTWQKVHKTRLLIGHVDYQDLDYCHSKYLTYVKNFDVYFKKRAFYSFFFVITQKQLKCWLLFTLKFLPPQGYETTQEVRLPLAIKTSWYLFC